jgi:hypothetical protein
MPEIFGFINIRFSSYLLIYLDELEKHHMHKPSQNDGVWKGIGDATNKAPSNVRDHWTKMIAYLNAAMHVTAANVPIEPPQAPTPPTVPASAVGSPIVGAQLALSSPTVQANPNAANLPAATTPDSAEALYKERMKVYCQALLTTIMSPGGYTI